jgi:hypothetical protein
MTDVVELLERANPIVVDEIGAPDELATSALLSRAMRPRPARAWRRPRVRWPARVVVAMVLVLGVGVPLAFGVGFSGWLVQVVRGTPIPPAVAKQFKLAQIQPIAPSKGLHGQRGLLIDSNSEHLVARIHTTTGHIASLYVARIEGGGWCAVAVGVPFGGTGCSRYGLNAFPYPLGFGETGSFGPRKGTRIATALTAFGHATSTRAASIRVTYRDGATGTIPLADGWYLYDAPLAHLHRGHEPIRFDVLDAKGSVIGTEKDPLVLEIPFVPPARPVPSSVRELARSPLDWRDADVVLSEGRDPKGQRCIKVLNTADTVQTLHWNCGLSVGNRVTDVRPKPKGPAALVQLNIARRVWPGKPGYVYLDGWAAAPIASLELRFQDSEVQPLPLYDRLFLFVVPHDHWRFGHRPSYLIGRDATGKVIFQSFLGPREPCTYPGPGNQCPPGNITVSG